ncbi:Cytochrome P450 CYP4/CYP19/CYP26 subfamily [Handroanthus impetiginosus]|uniref:Cytochrome P450 CYP4/CYP19/CYP26 subfamily n=1 Tax=Handroanthus impetiginosus TaxID=429701 RepID=A0A2G9G251_9LAMI|nr:Cytochrome P450 CYP4/CYP19/CYP26 subfamily [Handroanthus impetiginosus]PIM99392.1 Cytochrome P450 CYP4/CYP19/CYP26 subfamily [Handroanthus impetiginosus]
MGYLEIFLTIIFCSVFLLLLIPKNSLSRLPRNWPFIKLMPTMYLKSHKLYDKMTQVLAENNGTILFKTSWFTNLDILRGSELRKAFDFLGEAIFIKDLDEWREDKKFTHSFYKENQFHKSTPKIIHHTLEKGPIPVLDHISQQNQALDLQSLFNRYMLDATCLMATGFDPGSLRVRFPESPLLEAMDNMAEAVFFRHILPEKVWKLQRKGKENVRSLLTLNHILADYVSKKQKPATKNQQTEDFDVLKFYLSGSDIKGSSKKHTEETFLAENKMTLLFAGRDTSAALLTWFFYLISTNPLVKTKILQEISQNFPPEKRLFSKVEELSKLIYLHCALIDSLSLFPTAPVIIRDPTEEDWLPSGHKVDHKTKLILCSYSVGRTSAIWGKNWGEFKPERWLSDKGGMKHVSSGSFLAFGSGPWACPGRELAFVRMKAVAATILHNFGVRVSEGQRMSPSLSALLAMKRGLKATVSCTWM